MPFLLPEERLYSPEILDNPENLIIGTKHYYVVSNKTWKQIKRLLKGISVCVFEGEPFDQFLYKKDIIYRKEVPRKLYFYCDANNIPTYHLEDESTDKQRVSRLQKYGMPDDLINFYCLLHVVGGLQVTGILSHQRPLGDREIQRYYEGAGLTNFSKMRNAAAILQNRGIQYFNQIAEKFTPLISHEWERSIREKEIWEAKIRTVLEKFPPKRVFEVGGAHVHPIEKILKGENLPKPPPWQSFVSSLPQENKVVYEQLEQLLSSL